MSKVFRLTKRILPVLTDPAAIGRISDVSAIAGAGALARGVGALADLGVGILEQKQRVDAAFKVAKDATFVAEKSTTLERDVDTFFRDFQVTASNDPDGMRPEFDKFINDRFKELSKGASPAALAEFTKSRNDTEFKYGQKYDDYAQKQNVRNFDNSRKNSREDIAILAFRSGQDGDPLQPHLNSIDMVGLAATTFLPANILTTMNEDDRAFITQEWAQGRMENNAILFKEELDNKDYDDLLDVDQKQLLGKKADLEIQQIVRL